MAIAGSGCGRVGLKRVEGAVPRSGRVEVGDLEKLGLEVASLLARSGSCRHSSPHSTTFRASSSPRLHMSHRPTTIGI